MIPANLPIEVFGSQESNTLVLEFDKEVLIDKSNWSSSEFATEKRLRRVRRERKGRFGRKVVAGDMVDN